jgi:hypothetical protein
LLGRRWFGRWLLNRAFTGVVVVEVCLFTLQTVI